MNFSYALCGALVQKLLQTKYTFSRTCEKITHQLIDFWGDGYEL